LNERNHFFFLLLLLGFATDYKRCSETSTLPLSSFYSRLKSRNRCNHRDYQNISRNGARSTSMAREIMQTTARKTQTDNPAIVFYSMLANDVCNGKFNLIYILILFIFID